MERLPLNFGWEYTDSFSEEFCRGEGEYPAVDIPHSFSGTPFDYFDESVYQKVGGYRKRIAFPEGGDFFKVFLNVGAAAHVSEVFVDGTSVAEHFCGYTSYRADLTEFAKPGGTVLVAIKVDSRESLDVPPFGHVIDYMTYGGIYREIELETARGAFIEDVFAMPEASGRLVCRVSAKGEYDGVEASIGGEIYKFRASDEITLTVPSVRLWDIDSPYLYDLDVSLTHGGVRVDTYKTRIGFRDAEFRADGFYLNGRRVKLHGLDRHQSFPYVGYAMPRSMQRLDADILKRELGCNIVRTSHYPQSHHFIERCDEIGLLVFTEIPGWQYIGGDTWKDIAVSNVEEMVTQHRNHPSIVLWGVRINESVDDDDFYRRTNEAAHRLDPTRQTAGVRRLKRGRCLEDVFTYNDFLHDGKTPGCEKKRDVTSDMEKGYLVTEFNGHMFPTKTYDSEEHRLEHALRHARVLDAVFGEDDISGALGWCMFDYNTHRDFGSGDRICYHGVCDMFRNKKLAAAVYSSMQDEEPALEVSSTMDIGEHPAGNRGKTFVFTNADSVRFYKNGVFIREFAKRDSRFKNLPHPPIEVDDYIGDGIKNGEGFAPRQERYVKELLNYSARFGFSALPASLKAKAAVLMIRYGMKFEDMYALYAKYIGNWGDEVNTFRFDAIKSGEIVKTVTRSPVTSVAIKADVSSSALEVGETYDVACVRLRAVDGDGNVLPFMNEEVKLRVEGPIELIGPDSAALRGGLGGTYVRTTGGEGDALLTVSFRGQETSIRFTITHRSEK